MSPDFPASFMAQRCCSNLRIDSKPVSISVSGIYPAQDWCTSILRRHPLTPVGPLQLLPAGLPLLYLAVCAMYQAMSQPKGLIFERTPDSLRMANIRQNLVIHAASDCRPRQSAFNWMSALTLTPMEG